MYNGIIRHQGTLVAQKSLGDGLEIVLECPLFVDEELELGSSVAVNGVCLTVTQIAAEKLTFQLTQETLNKTTFASAKVGQHVNLARPIRANEYLDGHFLRGHVDGVGQVTGLIKDPTTWWLSIRFPEFLRPFLAVKGSVAIDGVSLTIVKVVGQVLDITLIPKTRELTCASHYQVGTEVNIEVDMLARYIVNFLENCS